MYGYWTMFDMIMNIPKKRKKFRRLKKHCYICHKPLLHGEDWLCPECKLLNDERQTQEYPSDLLKDRIAIVTGGRIKIGYETCLKLLRCGCIVILTTRFPIDAAYRYAHENDFEEWKNRLKIYKIDFRNIVQVEDFAAFLNGHLDYIDILINNAAQTVRRPKEYYEHLQELEFQELKELPIAIKELIYERSLSWDFFRFQGKIDELQTMCCDNSKSMDYTAHVNFPINKMDTNGDTLDLRLFNSWVSKVEDVDLVELLEVQFVNVTAPYILCARLKSAMKRSPHSRKFIINVSAMEGKFNRKNKNCYHPHTNMAKAALNMLTRTAAQDYKKDDIYMNSVDTGWITDENPYHIQLQNRSLGITPPLCSKDGAARVCDPILHSLLTNNRPSCGRFFKDYNLTSW